MATSTLSLTRPSLVNLSLASCWVIPSLAHSSHRWVSKALCLGTKVVQALALMKGGSLRSSRNFHPKGRPISEVYPSFPSRLRQLSLKPVLVLFLSPPILNGDVGLDRLAKDLLVCQGWGDPVNVGVPVLTLVHLPKGCPLGRFRHQG